MEPQEQSTKGNNKILIISAIIVAVVVGIGIFMSSNNQNPQAENTTADAVDQTVDSTTPEMTGSESGEQTAAGTSEEAVQTIEVEAGSFYYKPNEIRVKKGDKVRIVMNSVSMMHDFNIDELGVKLPIVQNGDTGTVEFVADQTGTFEYYCSVGQHRAQGQVGTFIVE